MKRSLFILFGIFTLALALRVPKLTDYPVGFTPDEAAYGYNAYSILLTGRDEWGTPAYSLPFTNLKSFGDYKLPLYAFLSVPSVRIFGLNEFAVRLPNALIGSLAVFSVFFLSLQLTRTKSISFYSAFFLAISPWGIGLSRGAFEANLAVFLLPLAIYLLMSHKIFTSALFFSLAFYSYHSARFLMLPTILLGYLYGKESVKTYAKFLIILSILIIPGIVSLSGSGMSRAADVGLFRPTDNWQALMADRYTAVKSGFPQTLAKFYYSKPLHISTQVISNYLSYFSPQFLFSTGAGESTYGLVPNTGLLYLIELPLLVGFLILFIRHPSKPLGILLLFILLMSIPAALAKGPGFAANRSVLMLPFLSLAAAIGLKYINRLSLLVIAVSFISLSQFLVAYAFQSPQALASGMLYGRRELFTRLQEMEKHSSQIRVSRSLSESHIYIAFYSRTPPAEYQENSLAWTGLGTNGFSFLDQTDYHFGKYYFSNLSFGGNDPSIILVGRPQDFELNYPQLFRINSPSGEPLIQVSPLRL